MNSQGPMTAMLATLCGSIVLVSSSTAQFIAPMLPACWIRPPDKAPTTPAPSPQPIPQWPVNHGEQKPGVVAQPDEKKLPGEAPKEYANVEELLAALETADKDLTTLTADITYDNIAGEVEGGDRQIRRGKVSFRNQKPTSVPAVDAAPVPAPLVKVPPVAPPAATPAPKPTGEAQPIPKTPDTGIKPTKPDATSAKSFAVTFDVVIKSGKQTVEARSFILNEGVLVEKLAGEKRINRYKLGGDAAKIDPLKIGEGPFPIPFGQKPADIKARFTVELLPGLTDVPAVKEASRQFFQDTYQLRLVPKPGTKAAKEFSEARIWFGKKDLLPVMARTTKMGGGSDEFRLINVQLNKPIEESVFSTATPEGWTLEEKEMR